MYDIEPQTKFDVDNQNCKGFDEKTEEKDREREIEPKNLTQEIETTKELELRKKRSRLRHRRYTAKTTKQKQVST